jgi:hypothetical protein
MMNVGPLRITGGVKKKVRMVRIRILSMFLRRNFWVLCEDFEGHTIQVSYRSRNSLIYFYLLGFHYFLEALCFESRIVYLSEHDMP